MARPTKLTNEIADSIAESMLHGATYRDACEAVGIWHTTMLDWMKRGEEEGKGKFYEFYTKIRKAEAQCRLNMTRVIQSAAAKGDWKAAEAYLKRRDRANWGDNVDLTSGGEKIIVTIKGIDEG